MSPPALSDLLTPGQMQLAAVELARLLECGYGDLTIVVRAGLIRFLRVTRSISALAPITGPGVSGDTAQGVRADAQDPGAGRPRPDRVGVG